MKKFPLSYQLFIDETKEQNCLCPNAIMTIVVLIRCSRTVTTAVQRHLRGFSKCIIFKHCKSYTSYMKSNYCLALSYSVPDESRCRVRPPNVKTEL